VSLAPVGRHRDVGRKHTAEADAEGLLDDHDAPGTRESGPHRITGKWSEGGDTDDPDALAGFPTGVDGVLDRSEYRSSATTMVSASAVR